MGRLMLIGVLVCLLACAGCASGAPSSAVSPTDTEIAAGDTQPPEGPARLPELGELDALRGASAVVDTEIDILAPLYERHTSISGESLLLDAPPGELALAIYRVVPPPGTLLTLSAAGAGPLWLVAADFDSGRWVFEPFSGGEASIDLQQFNPYSPSDWLYAGVICPQGESGQLDSMTLSWDEIGWDILVENDGDTGLTVSWNELPNRRYGVLRSMLSGDPAPYLVAVVDKSVDEPVDGRFAVTETVPEDAGGAWLPQMVFNGTPEELADDFPAIAPALAYYYRVVALHATEWGSMSAEASGMVPWGDRATAVNGLPSTLNQSGFVAHNLIVSEMTDAQVQFVAEHFAAGFDMTAEEVERVRQHNPGFFAITGQNMQISGKDYKQYGESLVYGNYADPDGDWPYLDAHEDWFMHDDASTFEHQRISASIYEEDTHRLMNLDSRYSEYLVPSLLSLQGETAFDGLELYQCHTTFGYSPWPEVFPDDGAFLTENAKTYLEPFMLAFTGSLQTAAAGFPRQPLIVADVWDLSNGPTATFSLENVDAVKENTFASGYGSGYAPAEFVYTAWEDELNRVLAEQAAGRTAFLLPRGDISHLWYHSQMRLFYYCSYLLCRGDSAFLGTYGSDYYSYDDSPEPYWYAEFDWDSGAPLDGVPETLDELRYWQFYPIFKRDFENGFVFVIPFGGYNYWVEVAVAPAVYEYLVVDPVEPGAIGDDGQQTWQYTWEPFAEVPVSTLYIGGGGGHIVRRAPDQP